MLLYLNPWRSASSELAAHKGRNSHSFSKKQFCCWLVFAQFRKKERPKNDDRFFPGKNVFRWKTRLIKLILPCETVMGKSEPEAEDDGFMLPLTAIIGKRINRLRPAWNTFTCSAFVAEMMRTNIFLLPYLAVTHLEIELERVPDPARRPGPEEKLAVNKTNTWYYLGPNLGQAGELFGKLDRAPETLGRTRLEKSSNSLKGSLRSS